LTLLLTNLIVNAQNLGFEATPATSPPNGWTVTNGTWTVTTDPNEVRTGVKAMRIINPSLFGSTIRTTNTLITTTSSQYLITIGWGKSNTPSNGVLRLGYRNSVGASTLNPSSTSVGQVSNLTNSEWTRISSVSANTVSSGSYGAAMRAFSSASITGTSVLIDDVVFYASSSNIPDLSAPNPASNLTLSNNIISWNNGIDNGAPASGIKGIMILRANGLYQTPPILNNQAMYNPISGELGTSSVNHGGVNWEVISSINDSSTTSFTDTSLSSSPVTYAVYMFDMAHNYSTAITLSNVCSNIIAGQSSASQTTICLGTNTNLELVGNSNYFGQAYQWQSAAAESGTYTNISAESDISSLSINPVSTAYYRCKLSCLSGAVVYSSPILVTVAPTLSSGTYTIGSGGDFQTLSSAISVLNCGISGPVVFNILPNSGPFNEPIILENSIGSSAINTVTFNFNNNQIIASPNSNSMGIVTLNGADYVTFNDMQIISIGTLQTAGVLISNQSNNISLNRCYFDLSSLLNSLEGSACIASSGSLTLFTPSGLASNNNNISINDCNLLSGGGSGIYLIGQSVSPYNSGGHIIQNCKIKNFRISGISIRYSSNCTVSNNDISSKIAFVNNFNNKHGISWDNGGFNNLISNNKIHDLYTIETVSSITTHGISFYSCDAPLGSENKIINNLIFNLNPYGNTVGILNQGSDGFHVFHNTIAEKVFQNNAGSFKGFSQSEQAANIIFRNNIVSYQTSKTGAAYNLHFSTSSSNIISDNNVLYHNGFGNNRFIGRNGTTDANTLSSWQNISSKDQQSTSLNPTFFDYDNGFLSPNNSLINNTGVFLGITNDIYNTLRSTSAPDAGAIEFDTILNDIAINSISFSLKNCPSVSDSLIVAIENTSPSIVDFSLNPIIVNWTINGPINSNGSTTISSGILSPNSIHKFIAATNVNTSESGIYNALANISAVWDMYSANDTSKPATKIIHSLDAYLKPSNIFQGQNTQLNIFTKNLNPIKFTEITFSPTGTGNNSSTLPNYTGIWPNNKIELSNLSNDTINIGGYKIEFLGIIWGTFTFSINTLLPPNKTVIIGMGLGPDQPTSLIFRSNLGIGSEWNSGTHPQGLILKYQDQILDAVAFNGYDFLAETGVNSFYWSGSINIPNNAAGMGLYISDNNISSNWISSSLLQQSIGNLNVGLSLTNSSTSWSGPNGFSGIGNSLSTGVLNSLGTYVYTATVNSGSCVYTDTAIVNVITANPDVASLGLTNTISNNCYSSSEQISVQIKNTSFLRSLDFTVDTLALSIEISGAIDTVLTTIINNNNLNGSLPLAADSVLNIPLGFIDMSSTGTYHFKAWAKMNGDINWQNDTAQTTSITIEPVFITSERDSICAGDTVLLSISGYNNAVNWEANTGSGWTSIGLATTLAVSPNTNTQYRAVYCNNRITDTVNIQVVSVNPPTIVSLQQSSLTQCEGLNANFNVIVNGTDLTYQWFKNNNAIQGAVNANLQLTNLLLSDSGIYFVSVTGACGSIVSSSFTFNVTPKTTITSEPLSLNICENTNANFSVAANGSGSLTYQWFKNGNIIIGANDSILTFNAITANDAANYTVAVYGTCGNILSDSAHLSLKESTVILNQPSSIIKCSGNQGVFSVTLNNSNNVSYQWKKNGLNIIGANASFVVLNNISAADTGNYSVDIFGVCGITSSSNASLSINSPATISIANHPQSASQCAGTNVNLSVNASGSAPLLYQWKKDGSSISGANNSTLSLNNLNSADNGNYSVEVSSTCATLLSNNATVSVQTAPVITSQPIDNSICQGGSVTLSVSASGLSPISYQWKKGNNTIANATQATYTLNNFSANNASTYSVEVSNACGTTTSNNAILTLSSPTLITSQPSSTSACLGTSAVFNVSAIGNNLTYQWRKSGVNINGATTSSLNFNNVALSDVALYSVAVSGQCGSATSNTAVLNVNALTTITTQPISTATICQGTNASISVVVAGTAPFSYQWKKDGIDIAGANTAVLALNNITASDSGSYKVTVSGACGTVTSNNAVRSFNIIPSIVSQPVSFSSCLGVAAEFSVEATGSNLAYQWRKNGSNISVNSINNGATMYLLGIINSDYANYSVIVSNTCGSVTSSNATLSAGSSPLASGTYTVGQGGDFKNISKAINAISCGISGPVIFNTLPNTEPFEVRIIIPNIPGTSSTNTITFNNVSIQGTNNRLLLSNAQYLRFNSLVLNQTNSPSSGGCMEINVSSNNIFNQCEIDATLANNTNSSAIKINSSSLNNAFNNCTIKGGGRGIDITGSGLNVETTIQNCTIENFGFYGIYAVNLKNTIIKNNDISRPTLNQGAAFYGIYMQGQCSNNLIESNKIHDCNTTSNATTTASYGIYFDAVSATIGSENKIINNAIYKLNNRGDVYGIYFSSSSGARIYHNTIAIHEPQITSSSGFNGFFSGTGNNLIFRNNIISHNRNTTGSSYNLYYGSNTSGVVSNNNLFYNGGKSNEHIGYFGSNRTSLANWQAANSANFFDLLSFFDDPEFFDYDRGILIPTNNSFNNIGASLGVLTDIDSVSRNQFPDIGAHEFNPNKDISLTGFTIPENLCSSISDSLFITIANAGEQILDFSVNPFTINADISGANNFSRLLLVNSGTLFPGTSQTYIIDNIDLSLKGIYEVSANLEASWDLQPFNNRSGVITKISHGINAFANPSNILVGQNSNLSILNGGLNAIKITEITYSATGLGNNTLSLPTYSTTWPDDKLEISNLSNEAVDIGGYQIEFLGTVSSKFTFPQNTILPPYQTAIIGMGSGNNIPASFIFRSNSSSNNIWQSASQQGIILSNKEQILDVLAVNGYIFPTSSGVNASHWSGTINIPTANAGIGRAGFDTNTGGDWVASSITTQTVGSINNGLILSNSPVNWTGPNNFSGVGSPLSTGPITTQGQHIYTASVTVGNCTYTDTAIVNVSSNMPEIAAEGLMNPSLSSECYSNSEPIVVKVRSTSQSYPIDFSVDTLNVYVQVTGEIDTLLITTISNNLLNGGVSLATNDTLNIPVGNLNMSNAGVYNFKSWVK